MLSIFRLKLAKKAKQVRLPSKIGYAYKKKHVSIIIYFRKLFYSPSALRFDLDKNIEKLNF